MKSKRHQKIIELITAEDIDTQEGILKGLRGNGLCYTSNGITRDQRAAVNQNTFC